jgi:hypothetical protein
MNYIVAQIYSVPAYAHTFFSFFCIFYLFCADFFVHLPFIFSFLLKCHKNKIQLKSIKKISTVCYRCSALTSTGYLTNIATSNAKTHNTKVVDLFSLSFTYIDRLFWITKLGDNDPENGLARNFRIPNRFNSNTNNSLIMMFSGKLVNTKVLDKDVIMR